MRARLALTLRAVADRLAGQPDLDSLRLDVRRLEADLAHQRRLTASANDAAERAYRERDAANAQATSWLRIAGDQSEALIRQGAARDRQVPPPAPDDRVVRPVFGRRRPPA